MSVEPEQTQAEVDTAKALGEAMVKSIGRIVVGKEGAVRTAIAALFAGGHILVEDVPGTGKTTLARALAAAIDVPFGRIQFTPDLMPGDILGVNIFNVKDGVFTFKQGPVFAGVVLADEINRATPRTQSALLEAMQEGQVSIDGETHRLPKPFIVIATQNPVEMDGTFRLPESQLDRFAIRLSLGYPNADEEDAMLRRFEHGQPDWTQSAAVASAESVLRAKAAACAVTVGTQVRAYILDIARATRELSALALGVSPRGTLTLQRVSQSLAMLAGRTFVLPDDVKSIAPAVLGHRVIVDTSTALRGETGASIVRSVVESLPVPMGDSESAPAG